MVCMEIYCWCSHRPLPNGMYGDLLLMQSWTTPHCYLCKLIYCWCSHEPYPIVIYICWSIVDAVTDHSPNGMHGDLLLMQSWTTPHCYLCMLIYCWCSHIPLPQWYVWWSIVDAVTDHSLPIGMCVCWSIIDAVTYHHWYVYVWSSISLC